MTSHFWRVTAWLSLTLALVAGTAPAQQLDETPSTRLRKALTPGNTVDVTRWTGRKVRGQVLELTDCALVLRVSSEPVHIPFDAIRKVTRHQPRKTTRAAKMAKDVANHCDECSPGALVSLSVAALVKAFDGGGHASKVAYQAKQRPPTAKACVSVPGVRASR